MERIGKIRLENQGAFDVRISCKFKYGNGTHDGVDYPTVAYPTGKSHTADIGDDLGVKADGVEVWLNAVVIFGKEHAAKKERFIYQKGSQATAKYVITGTTLDSHLHYEGIE